MICLASLLQFMLTAAVGQLNFWEQMARFIENPGVGTKLSRSMRKMSDMKLKQWYTIHVIIERSRLISPGTGETWIESIVVEDEDGPMLFDEHEDARWYLETDDIHNWVDGYKVVGFEIHETYLPKQGQF